MHNKYFLSDSINIKFDYSIKIFNYYLNHNYTSKKIKFLSNHDKALVLIGDFIDAKNPNNTLEESAEELFSSNNLRDLMEKSRSYAGRFIILYGTNTELKYILTDPVVSIPVNYSFINNQVYIASHAKMIANYIGLNESEGSMEIKKGAEQQQPLPYNITMYNEINALIPNHYLDINAKKMDRFFPITPLTEASMDVAVEKTINYSKEILSGYFKTRKLSLPMTSGVDSRTVLSLMKDNIGHLEMYTFYLDNFSDETGDIRIPKEISNFTNIKHHKLPVLSVPDTIRENIHLELFGLENDAILNHGYTYSQSDISEYHSVPGDIISLAKSPFGKNLPESLATLGYFLTKTHNYSSEIKKYVEKWMNDTKEYSKQNNVSMYDLYNLEYRMGRWLPKSIQNYDYFIDQIYIFNCRVLIELWLSIPREQRTKRSLHLEIIKSEWPELLNYDINPDDKLIDKLFSNSYMFYLGSFAKYFLGKWK